jgi:hypothetical protein
VETQRKLMFGDLLRMRPAYLLRNNAQQRRRPLQDGNFLAA